MAVKKQKYFNRETSWVEFNARVLGEAVEQGNPLLERVRFAGIFAANLDEFFMVRVAGLKGQIAKKRSSTCPTGMSPAEQFDAVRTRTETLVAKHQRLIEKELVPSLHRRRIRLLRIDDLDRDQRQTVETYFATNLFPILTPLRMGEEFPFAENLASHIAVTLRPTDRGDPLHAIVRIPRNVPGFVPGPGPGKNVVPVEPVVQAYVGGYFPGYEIEASLPFRVTRDADLGVDESRDEDFVLAMEEVLVDRQSSRPVRIETGAINESGEIRLLNMLLASLKLKHEDHYVTAGLVGADRLVSFVAGLERPDLREPVWPAATPSFLQSEESIFDSIRMSDRMVHLPYDSYEAVLTLITEAARDTSVIAIKITLYRTSGDSPIVKALKEAAERGVQVTAFVELKARFDEEQNIGWAHELERVGVIVVLGIAHLKVHAKAMIIVRREPDGIRRYAHLSTGNYNDRTARYYTDVGLFTANDDFASDVGLFFNAITGYSSISSLRYLAMGPTSLKDRILGLIRREAARCQESGRIAAKLNSVADPDVVDALYEVCPLSV